MAFAPHPPAAAALLDVPDRPRSVTRALTAPGMWFQLFTTNEPDDSMIEVAIEALTMVIPTQEGADRW